MILPSPNAFSRPFVFSTRIKTSFIHKLNIRSHYFSKHRRLLTVFPRELIFFLFSLSPFAVTNLTLIKGRDQELWTKPPITSYTRLKFPQSPSYPAAFAYSHRGDSVVPVAFLRRDSSSILNGDPKRRGFYSGSGNRYTSSTLREWISQARTEACQLSRCCCRPEGPSRSG